MVNKRAFLIAIFSVGAADAVAGSGPLIDGLEVGEDSVIEAGQKVTLKGENFGSAPGVVLWDTVGNQTAYQGINDGEAAPSGDVWGRTSVLIDREGTQRHAYSTAQYESVGGGETHRVARPVVPNGFWEDPEQDELFVSWWIKFDRNIYEADNNAAHKLIRVWGGGSSDFRMSWNSRNSIGAYDSNDNSPGSITSYSLVDATKLWKKNQWQLHEIWVSAKEGEIKAYVDGKLVNHWQSDDSRFLKKTHPKGPRLTLLGWNPSHGNGVIDDAKFKMSDIAVQTSQARVLISDENKFSESENHEYQPILDWSNSEVSINVNYGALSKEDDLYLYLVDSEGVVNDNGYLLKGCTRCPAEIEDVIIE